MPHAQAQTDHHQPPVPQSAPQKRLTVREITIAVSAVAQVPLDVLISPRRDPYSVLARWVVMRIARQHGRSLAEIGRIINRDHTTVIHGLQTSQSFGNYAPERARMLAAIEAEAVARLEANRALAPYTAPVPVATLTWHQVHKARQLRRRGWSVAGIARYVEADQAAIEIAVGAHQP
tara:strand:- start:11146 stop:11676 length:531 start_codon:yes stop_codon:yes gene_type:complete